jgi:hypothetical protein
VAERTTGRYAVKQALPKQAVSNASIDYASMDEKMQVLLDIWNK